MDDKTFFIVTSHGWSGSYWLAHALNLHPEIMCSHSAENLAAEGPNLHTTERHKQTVRSLHHGMQARQSRHLDTTYDEIVGMGEATAYGSVHVYRLRDLVVQAQKHGGFRRGYQLANLVRHPMSFTWSGYGQLREMFTYDIFVLRGTLNLILGAEEFIFELAKRHGLNLADFEVAAFLGAAANMYNLAKDVQVGRDTSHIRMETITQDRALFARVVSFLSNGALGATEDYLEKVYGAGELNKHRKGTAKMGPKARYESLTDWQREAFDFFLESSGIRAAYESLEYDFSFVGKGGRPSEATPVSPTAAPEWKGSIRAAG